MNYRFQFRRYRLPFRSPVRTAHGLWTEREGLLVRLTDESGNSGLGEAAVMPYFGTETADAAEMACRELGEWLDDGRLAGLPAELRCLRNAITAARASLEEKEKTEDVPGEKVLVKSKHAYLGVAALLPAGRGVLAAIEPKAEAGFRVFKWKVGVGDVADELSLLDDVCAALPTGAKLRLDANGAWNRRQAERWMERCAERPVEFVEQPCFADASQGAREQRKMDDVLLGLAGDFPTAIALDESLVSDGDAERWIGAGWPGVFVVKPSLFGDVAGVMEKLKVAKASVVFSSALETAVGAKAALAWAFAWGGEPRALGFGVWPLFSDARCDGPHVAPFLRREDVERIDPEAAWNALN